MTPEQIALVQSSFHSLGPTRTDLAACFYRNVFDRDPELRALFPSDIAQQELKFVDQLQEIVSSVSDLEEFLPRTRALGYCHAGYGVRVADYATVGEALLDALAASLGEAFDGQAREAWVLVYNLTAETMLDGAASARRPSG